MTRRISLALTLHNHQPVGNFGWVIAETYERAYLPMLEALERHPGVQLALHYTGPLIEWLRAERPDFLDRLGRLVERGQVEIVGGGWYEPVLAALPERDRVGQLVRMADELERQFGRRPSGAWLAERVWEPDLPTSLVTAGYRWTVLDDAHFRAAAIPEAALWGPYTTDDQGKVLTVFGTEQGLRYRIPFSDVEDVIGYLRDHATEGGERVGTMGDDGEKFGGWPTTYEHCWGEAAWVERFFSAIEASRDWLATVTPTSWLEGHGPVGRVYLPTGSYAEMGEWALPADESRAFAEAVHEAQAAGRPEARWLRGAIWRNFQVKYREVNDLHKQMLRASDLVDAMPPGVARERALDHLLAGQSNDCYWHGLFGGIYLPDLRVAALRHLIAAEDLALGSPGASVDSGRLVDLDLDGRAEVLLVGDGQIVGVKLDEGAGIGRWDIREAAVPLAAVMRRRPEAYHAKLRAHEAGAGDGNPAAAGGGAPASIHDIVTTKQTGLSERLVYDSYERRSGLVRLLPVGTTSDAFAAGSARDLIRAFDGAWTVRSIEPSRVVAAYEEAGVALTKSIEVGGDRGTPTLDVDVHVQNSGEERLDALLGIEFAVMLLGGGHNPSARYEVGADERFAHDERRDLPAVTTLSAANDQLGVAIVAHLDRPADAWIAPIETVSNSEAGFELVYQGSAVLFVQPIGLDPGESTSFSVGHGVIVGTTGPVAAAPRT
ncbi:MAG TPA: alpha-amylase/4-alpha-glucanotransferase domain-containing protein [Candidatus Limnocylindrales bacterium]|nr:alpha-amylase/4-alpha-glucanotransferase domain-containing protein [Candidatus Limnocylindrales bacterium]